MKKNNRIYSKYIMLTLLLVFTLAACIIIGGKRVEADESITYEKSFLTYEIKAGDTLSDIAAQHAANPSDYQFYINEVKSINNLKSDTIHAGCYLLIPTYTPVQD